MAFRRFRPVTIVLMTLAGGALSACGTRDNQVDADSRYGRGAQLFAERCTGCHTLDIVGTKGSSANINTRERTDGPNFNVRVETPDRVLYAIRNGGYSGAIMPQNIVVGDDAQAVADFVAKYSGSEVSTSPDQSSGGRQQTRGTTPEDQLPEAQTGAGRSSGDTGGTPSARPGDEGTSGGATQDDSSTSDAGPGG